MMTGGRPRLDELTARLERTHRYGALVSKLRSGPPTNMSFVFEGVFADAFEFEGFELAYERVIASSSKESVDFAYPRHGQPSVCFELLRVEMGAILAAEYGPKEDSIAFGAALEGDHPNPYLRPQAQTIRLQEKILEKVGKFPEPADELCAIIVVDCSEVQFGGLDAEDCRMVLYGKTRAPMAQEYWGDSPIRGLLDPQNNRRGASTFRSRISAVVFIPDLSWEPLNGALIVYNTLRPLTHLRFLQAQVAALPPMRRVANVFP